MIAWEKPMIYCNSRWFTLNLDLSRLTEYDKWFAQYYNRPFFPYDFQIWQYTSAGKVDGIDGKAFPCCIEGKGFNILIDYKSLSLEPV